MTTVLITGGAGFIGSHTADALVRTGRHVRILDLLDPQIHGPGGCFPAYMNPAVECIRGDVRDPAAVAHALDGVDEVLHLASLTGVGQSMYDIRSYADTNVLGTVTLLETIVRKRPDLRRIVLSSSRAIYGEGACACPQHGYVEPAPRSRARLEAGLFGIPCPHCGADLEPLPTTETKTAAPISVYALTKREQEDYCRYVAQTFGLPVVMLRYFNVFGSRQSLQNPYTGIVSIFYARLQAGRPISVYERGLPLRDFVHVSDVVRANLLALDAAVAPGAVYNVGSGERCTVGDIASLLAAALGVEADLQDLGEFRVGDIYACVADLERSRRELGYAPQTSLADGMKEFVAWAKTQDAADRYAEAVAELQRHQLMGRAQAE